MLHSVLSAIIGFFLIRFLIQYLGEKQYGVWVLVASVFQFRLLLNMGLNSAVNRYIPVCLAKQDYVGVNKVISTTFFFYCCIAIILAIISVIIYFNVGRWFKIEPELIQSARNLVLIVGGCFSLVVPLQMSSAILSGIQRHDILNLAFIITLLAKTALLVVLVLKGFGLLTVGLIFAGSEIVPRIIQYHFSKKLMPTICITTKNVEKRLLLEMGAYGVNSMLYAINIMVLAKASSIIIAIFLGTTDVSYFAIALSGVKLISLALQPFSRAIQPAASDLGARNDDKRLNEMAFLSQKYSLLMLIPSACFFVVMGREFLTVWMGPAIADPATIGMMATILTILTVANGLRLAQHSNYVVLLGLGEHRVFGFMTVVNSLLFIGSAVLCLSVFQLGLLAVAWSFFVPMVLISGVFLPIYYRYKRKIRWADNMRQVWAPAVLGTLPAVVLIILWKYFNPPDSWLGLIAVVAAAATLTVTGSWLLSLSSLEKKRFIKIINRK